MILRKLIVLAAIAGVACSASGQARDGDVMYFSTSKPLRHCLELGDLAPNAASREQLRLLITFNAYRPPASGHAGFQVSTLHPDTQRYEPLDQFAIHPPSGFDVGKGQEPHRFQISLAPHARSLRSDKYCFELRFVGNDLDDGDARVEVKLKGAQ